MLENNPFYLGLICSQLIQKKALLIQSYKREVILLCPFCTARFLTGFGILNHVVSAEITILNNRGTILFTGVSLGQGWGVKEDCNKE